MNKSSSLGLAATRMIGVGAPMAVDPALLRGRVRAGKLAGP